jgi:O-methyltransferase involved in polyketide biosynthesis
VPLIAAHGSRKPRGRAVWLSSTPEGATAYVHADLREADKIMAEAATTLDFTEPIALILSGILGHVTDTGEARSTVRRLMRALPSGSYLSLNDGTSVVAGEAYEEAQEDYNQSGAIPYVLRTPEEIASFFDGLELVEPGVVSCPRWRPDPTPSGPLAEVDAFGGVGRKP